MVYPESVKTERLRDGSQTHRWKIGGPLVGSESGAFLSVILSSRDVLITDRIGSGHWLVFIESFLYWPLTSSVSTIHVYKPFLNYKFHVCVFYCVEVTLFLKNYFMSRLLCGLWKVIRKQHVNVLWEKLSS